MPMSPPKQGAMVRPGAALKAYRNERGLTLADLSQKTGLHPSTLSKIENGKETTIDTIVRISLALGVSIADLFSTPTNHHTRRSSSRVRSITRRGEGQSISSPNGVYYYQAYDLLNKNITPIIGEVHARSLEEFGALHRHAGEEFVYVIEGELAFYSDTYTPAYLKAGDTVYFDSGMGHAYVAVGDKPCRILSVFLTPDDEAFDLMESISDGTPAPAPKSKRRKSASAR